MNAITRFTEGFNNFTSTLGLFCSDAERKEVVTNTWSRLHRTTQQQFMKVVIIPILQQLADDYSKGWCDGRNMHSAQLAHKMLEHLDYEDLYLPFV